MTCFQIRVKKWYAGSFAEIWMLFWWEGYVLFQYLQWNWAYYQSLASKCLFYCYEKFLQIPEQYSEKMCWLWIYCRIIFPFSFAWSLSLLDYLPRSHQGHWKDGVMTSELQEMLYMERTIKEYRNQGGDLVSEALSFLY